MTRQAFYFGAQCVVLRRSAAGSCHPEVLLGRRTRTTADGQWALPGGHVEWGETPLDAARRELAEETGLRGGQASFGQVFCTYSTKVPYVHVPVIFADAWGELKLSEGECFSELDYFLLDALPEPLFEPSRIVLTLLALKN